MDALALLCNLHADGPDSLLQLREAGCDRLELLAALEVEELSTLLGTSRRATRRFLEEARLLSERLTGQPLDGEVPSPQAESLRGEAPWPAPGAAPEDGRTRPVPAPQVSADAREEVGDALDEGDPDADLEYPRPGPRRRTGEPVADVVLDAWRELDAEEPGGDFAGADAGPEGDRSGSGAVLVPRPPPAAQRDARTLLAQAELEGLTDEVRRQLVAGGLTTVEELLASDSLEIARRCALPFTRIERVRFLARRAFGEVPDGGAPYAPRHR